MKSLTTHFYASYFLNYAFFYPIREQSIFTRGKLFISKIKKLIYPIDKLNNILLVPTKTKMDAKKSNHNERNYMLNDLNLLESYRKGEKEAFLTLYNKHSHPLKKFLQGGFSFSSQGKICRFKGADAAMDVNAIVQETFTRAFIPSTRKNYDGDRPFQTYLFSIAKNLVLRECYQRDRMVNVEHIENTLESKGASIFSSRDSYGQSPEQHLQNMELKKITENFFNSLNEEEQKFFSTRFADGNTQEKSAEIMNITRARIKLLEKNIRKRFLDLMRKNGYLVEHKINPRWRRKHKEQKIAA